jgi:DNA-binding response OmpR family regulator
MACLLEYLLAHGRERLAINVLSTPAWFKRDFRVWITCHNRCADGRRLFFSQVQLRSTMACLLEYLLAHGRERLVSDEELMINVWEKNNLRPSAQRLWQVILQ